ncbi:hypothetical protein M6D81_24685 [Paenibacillus sp. J5C_2022]|uniref:hypothetical protein n=1 Tax=Paenibacillus sp. J5C2022 TaxID=2977129 RepID=UPI0021D1DDB2|nr:hypothetical protein [Paenibacillus sp. J5C2022]MCU6711903.1 hypothetical protein [Paenibacillus sp. J5C2022]
MTTRNGGIRLPPALEKLTDWSRFPVSSRVGQAAREMYQNAYNPEYAYRFGLERIIEGTAVLIERADRTN